MRVMNNATVVKFNEIALIRPFQAASEVLLHDGALAVPAGQPDMRHADRLV